MLSLPGTMTRDGSSSVTAEPTRRALLAASAAGLPLLLASCRGIQVLGSPPPPPADVDTLRAAIAAEKKLVKSYLIEGLRVTGAPGRARAVLAMLLGEHQQHLAQLESRLVLPAPAPSGPGEALGWSGYVSGLDAVLSKLELAEQAASDRLIGQLAGLPPALAQLFASIAASEATHVPVLRDLGRHP